MKIKLREFDPANYLTSEKMIQYYLEEALDTGDAAFFAEAVGDVARARGMAKVAKNSGLSRESLYKALSPSGNPEFATILKVMHSMGLKLSVVAEKKSNRKSKQMAATK